MDDWKDIPGGDLIRQGLDDLAAQRNTTSALLIRIAEARLSRLGIGIPESSALSSDPQLQLYRELCESAVPDPYSQYNALLRTLASFASSLEHRQWRRKREALK